MRKEVGTNQKMKDNDAMGKISGKIRMLGRNQKEEHCLDNDFHKTNMDKMLTAEEIKNKKRNAEKNKEEQLMRR